MRIYDGTTRRDAIIGARERPAMDGARQLWRPYGRFIVHEGDEGNNGRIVVNISFFLAYDAF